MAVGTGDQAPEFDLEEAFDEPRLRLQDFRGKRNVLLVFHPFAFTPVCSEEALDLQANLKSFEDAETDVIFVSCDSSAARQAWKRELGATYAFASDFWQHGAAARAYGVFDEAKGMAGRGSFLVDGEGILRWSVVNPPGRARAISEYREAVSALAAA